MREHVYELVTEYANRAYPQSCSPSLSDDVLRCRSSLYQGQLVLRAALACAAFAALLRKFSHPSSWYRGWPNIAQRVFLLCLSYRQHFYSPGVL